MAAPAPTPDPGVMFAIAEQYLRASTVLLKERPPTAALPAIVCQAFAFELFLKCLVLLERGKIPQEHQFTKLFKRLNPATQDQIRVLFLPHLAEVQAHINKAAAAANVPVPIASFDTIMAESKDAFTAMRYAYEGIRPKTGWSAFGALMATRQIILGLHPEWARAVLDLNLPMSISDHQQ